MSQETVECYNCGRANPPWAQVCRSCGVPIRPGTPRRPEGAIPTDQESLISMGTGVGAILLAVLVGIMLSGIIPAAPAITSDPTPTLQPTPTTEATASAAPSVSASGEPATQEPKGRGLPGTIAFGHGLDADTSEVTNPTSQFAPGTRFAHSVSMPERFGVSEIFEEVIKVRANGARRVVQHRERLEVDPEKKVAGFATAADLLRNAWGPGRYILRVFREDELIAHGAFRFTE